MSNQKIEKGINRRSFLRSTAAVGAGLVFSPMVSAQTGSSEKADDINVALLGAGEQGQVLIDACMKIPGLRFKAVCDIWTDYNQKKVSRRLKAYRHENNTYLDYREMLDKEKDLDAVIIATPDFWHAEHTIACLKAGLNVYCEKEMSNTLEGARKIVQAAKETGKLLQIGHQRRSNPRYIHCFDKLLKEAKILGRITTINGQWNRAARPDIGTPEKYAIDQATLEKYGFKSMHQFRNWRWYKGLGGGPIVDLGSHQIDIYNWFLEVNPKSVMAGGDTDYYDKETHQWYDNVMAIYEYQTPSGTVRAFYQTITTNSSQGYFESFMGDQATLLISESAGRGAVYREPSAPQWDKWVKLGFVNEPAKKETPTQEKPQTGAVLDVRETMAPPAYELPVKMDKLYHQPHLENFFDAIRGKAKLNCPPEIGYETAVTVLKVNEAVEAARKLEFKPKEFKV
ncbi:MAG: Gfo/Idh/MocA family oxidoreductase [Sedimentisphaerales bacterium]|nr:Gfo/Idh/MocA family oxidoreductase [Sedimentisphaerales bacterium]